MIFMDTGALVWDALEPAKRCSTAQGIRDPTHKQNLLHRSAGDIKGIFFIGRVSECNNIGTGLM